MKIIDKFLIPKDYNCNYCKHFMHRESRIRCDKNHYTFDNMDLLEPDGSGHGHYYYRQRTLEKDWQPDYFTYIMCYDWEYEKKDWSNEPRSIPDCVFVDPNKPIDCEITYDLENWEDENN